MFSKKSKKIKKLEKALESNALKQREEIYDFILILNQLEEINNSKLQWKRRQSTLNNTIELSREKYTKKIVELDIDPQY